MGVIDSIKAFGSKFYQAVKSITVDTIRGGSGILSGYGFNTSFTNPSFNRLASLALRNPVARSSINFIAENLASIPLKIVRVNSEGEEEDLGEHEILELLRNPAGKDNPRYTKEWLFKGKVWAMMAGGEYWLQGLSPDAGRNEGVPRKLRLFHSDDFSHFKTDQDGFISGYQLNYDLPYGSKPVNTTTEETLHVFNFNPRSRYRGVPILLSVLRALDILEDADNWNKNISQNRGQIPGWFMPRGLEPGETLDPEQKEQAQEQVDESVNKGRKGHKWRVLGGAYEPVENNITPEEASFLEAMRFYSNQVAIGIGVDPIIVGDESAKTYDNFQTALLVSFTTSIIPMLEFMLSSFNRHMTPKFEDANERLEVTFDPMDIDAIREANLQKVESVIEATGGQPILTPDEGRSVMGREPVGADDLVMDLNLQPHNRLFAQDQGMDIDTDMSSIGAKDEDELMHDIERLVNGKSKTDNHRKNGVKEV